MGLTTAAAGVISEPLQLLRVTLADCTEFRSWTSTANQTEALDRIHIAGLPPISEDEYTETEMDSLRPFAIVENDVDSGNTFDFHGTTSPNRHYKHSGRCFATLEQSVPSALEDDPAELDRQFQNTLGNILKHSSGSGGLLDLAGTATYLAINTLTVHGPIRATHEEAVASGDSIAAIFEITWGQR